MIIIILALDHFDKKNLYRKMFLSINKEWFSIALEEKVDLIFKLLYQEIINLIDNTSYWTWIICLIFVILKSACNMSLYQSNNLKISKLIYFLK